MENPDFPLLDLQPSENTLRNHIGIMEDELTALARIDALLEKPLPGHT